MSIVHPHALEVSLDSLAFITEVLTFISLESEIISFIKEVKNRTNYFYLIFDKYIDHLRQVYLFQTELYISNPFRYELNHIF